ncbi:MAG: sulfurtransferase TusA family protein [Chloroflexi bacterium]|nr:sulfurtransferase TusA family protein [Chloroflexota bacterium]
MSQDSVAQSLNLTGVLCPINWARTKLTLEEMETGEILEVILDKGEPIRNVPRSAKDEGHTIIAVERLGEQFKLLIKKGG